MFLFVYVGFANEALLFLFVFVGFVNEVLCSFGKQSHFFGLVYFNNSKIQSHLIFLSLFILNEPPGEREVAEAGGGGRGAPDTGHPMPPQSSSYHHIYTAYSHWVVARKVHEQEEVLRGIWPPCLHLATSVWGPNHRLPPQIDIKPCIRVEEHLSL